jgi:hypothetical protein
MTAKDMLQLSLGYLALMLVLTFFALSLPGCALFEDKGADSSDLFARQARWSHLNDGR